MKSIASGPHDQVLAVGAKIETPYAAAWTRQFHHSSAGQAIEKIDLAVQTTAATKSFGSTSKAVAQSGMMPNDICSLPVAAS